MRRAALALALAAAGLAGCAPPPAAREPAPSPRYALGEPLRLGGLWAYPREDFALVQQGVADVLAVPRPPRLSASGEPVRAQDLVAAHPTLQLPAIVAVTNLETGRTLRVRVIERGPDRAGRVLAVSPRAAELLGARGGPFQARVEVDGEASRAAIAGLPGLPEGPRLAAAPAGRVEREALAPPPGARGSAGPALAARAEAARPSEAPPRPAPLPETVTAGPARPGRLLLEGSTFFRRDLAQRQAALLPGGRAEPAGPPGRQQPWRAVAGPFATVAEADAALARAAGAGVAELRLVVE